MKRLSSISTSGFVDQFRNIGGQVGAKMEPFAGDRMGEAELGGMERLPAELEPVEQGAELFRSASIDWIAQ